MSASVAAVHRAIRFGCLCAAAALIVRPSATAATDALPMTVVRVASGCAGVPDAVGCLLRAAATGVDALARSDEPVQLVPGCVTLVKNNGPAAGRDTTPAAASAADALVDSVAAFAESRAINVRAPATVLATVRRALTEARGKKDKMTGPLLMGAMMVAGTLLPIKLGALAIMSGKALMTSMLALMLAAILALKKLASGGGGGGGGSHSGTTYEVINVPSTGAHSSHGRSSSLAHSLAYGLPVVPVQQN